MTYYYKILMVKNLYQGNKFYNIIGKNLQCILTTIKIQNEKKIYKDPKLPPKVSNLRNE